jgi:predicted RNase H-like HicB family nuclease
MKFVSFKEYVRTILEAAEYKRDSEIGCVVAIAPVLPGCMTQGDNFEEARDNLIDAIELWLTVGLREGQEMPLINGVKLVTAVERPERSATSRNATYA